MMFTQVCHDLRACPMGVPSPQTDEQRQQVVRILNAVQARRLRQAELASKASSPRRVSPILALPASPRGAGATPGEPSSKASAELVADLFAHVGPVVKPLQGALRPGRRPEPPKRTPETPLTPLDMPSVPNNKQFVKVLSPRRPSPSRQPAPPAKPDSPRGGAGDVGSRWASARHRKLVSVSPARPQASPATPSGLDPDRPHSASVGRSPAPPTSAGPSTSPSQPPDSAPAPSRPRTQRSIRPPVGPSKNIHGTADAKPSMRLPTVTDGPPAPAPPSSAGTAKSNNTALDSGESKVPRRPATAVRRPPRPGFRVVEHTPA